MIVFKINKAGRVAAFFIIFCGVFMLAGGVFLTKDTLITGKPISDSRGMDISSTLLLYGMGVYMLLAGLAEFLTGIIVDGKNLLIMRPFRKNVEVTVDQLVSYSEIHGGHRSKSTIILNTNDASYSIKYKPAGFDNWLEMMNFLSENVTYVQP